MSQYYGAPPQNQYGGGATAQNLQFYPSSYSPGIQSHGTPSQAGYGYGGGSASYGGFGGQGAPGVSGRMGEQGGLRTGWLAAFSTEGYENEPPLLEELGFNFDHIQRKVSSISTDYLMAPQLLTHDLVVDTCRSQPIFAHRPTSNGRLRPRRAYIVLHSIWFLPAL
jgi:protein YIPF5/7